SAFSFSKTFALTGWRVGYVIAPPPVARAIEQIHWALAMGPSTVGQIAARECLRVPTAYHTEVVDSLRRNGQIIMDALDRVKIPYYQPAGGLFVWADIGAITRDDRAFVAMLRQVAAVLV